MQGLALARNYYLAYRDRLLEPYAAYRGRIAAGLVGFGSECFGFDDALSRDHDFGPGFCVWLSDEDYAVIGAAMQADYERLPPRFAGFDARVVTARSGQRVGVFSLSGFYGQFLGAPQLPISEADWLQIPEEFLACAVNGEVFADPLGAFSAVRATLAGYYPERVKRRKLAQAVAKMAQSGQYNLPRAVQRGDMAAALLAQAEFIRHACCLVYALNNRYAPIAKWLHRGIADLPVLGELHGALDRLARTGADAATPQIEEICAMVLAVLVALRYTRPGDAFLEAHVDDIMGQASPSQDRFA